MKDFSHVAGRIGIYQELNEFGVRPLHFSDFERFEVSKDGVMIELLGERKYMNASDFPQGFVVMFCQIKT